MRIVVFGAGYAGLVSGAGLARAGHEVAILDISAEKIESLRRGLPPFHEPGLPELLREGFASGRLRVTSSAIEALDGCDASLIAVGTPSSPEGGIDLSQVLGASRTIGDWFRRATRRHTVVIKSTVVPGSTEGPIRRALEESSGLRAGADFGLGMNPEFLREGSAVEDFLHPDRIVFGCLDSRTAEVLREMYESFSCPKIETTPTNAELIKYASNSLLALLVSFSNEWAAICEDLPGADAAVVMNAVHLDRRFSPGDGGPNRPGILSYLIPGPGFGGSCLPKDLSAARSAARRLGVPTPVLDAVARVNEDRPRRVLDFLRREIGELRGRTVAILGLAFKPGTDDVRESPALPLMRLLAAEGTTCRVWDPMAPADVGGQFRSSSAEHALGGADAAILVTAWPEIAQWNWKKLLPMMRQPVILDARGSLRAVSWPEGVRYLRIGTGPVPDAVRIR